MTCRATGTTTCSGSSPTGAVLQSSPDGLLEGWQNAPSGPSATQASLYDAGGKLVEQRTTTGSGVTTTVFVGDLEEVSSGPSGSGTTDYFSADGQRVALSVNGTFFYPRNDAEGTPEVPLDATGNAVASVTTVSASTIRWRASS
jgi:hypothetical protein